jgi:hypothetical protein
MTNLRIPIELQPELLEDGRYRISWNPQSCLLPAFGHYVGTLDQVLTLLKKHAPHKPGDKIICLECGGRGWIDGKPVTLGDTPLEPCPTCKGTGKVTVKSVTLKEVVCECINGGLFDGLSWNKCPNCHKGKYWVWDEWMI